MRRKITLFLFVSMTLLVASASEKVAIKSQGVKTQTLEVEKVTDAVVSEADAVADAEVTNDATFKVAVKGISPKADGDVEANFSEPEGLFTVGISEAGGSFKYGWRKGPAHQDLTWTNTSTGATSYVWSYQDPTFEAEDKLVSSETNLTASYPYSRFAGPSLSATDGTTTSTFGIGDSIGYSLGGATDISSSNDDYYGIMTYPSPFHRNAKGYGYTYSSYFMYDVSGSSSFNEDGVYSSWSKYMSSYDSYKLTGFANIFEAPAAPYTISKVWAWLNVTATEATSLNVAIVKIDDEGYITSDTVASGTATIPASDSETDYVSFELVSKDADGFETTDPIVIDGPILVVINGFAGNSAIQKLYPTFGNGCIFSNSAGNTQYTRHAYTVFDVTEDGVEKNLYRASPVVYYVDSSVSKDIVYGVYDWLFMLDAEFSYLVCDEDGYAFGAEGGSHTFSLESYYSYSDSWTVEEANGNDISWLSMEAYNVPSTSGTGFSGEVQLTVTAAQLPAGVTSREANLELSYPGTKVKTLAITQSSADGVSMAVVEKAATVAVNGDNFVVKASDDVTGATVYSVSGQKVAEASVDGSATIDASGLADGMYIVKLSNGKAVKVIK